METNTLQLEQGDRAVAVSVFDLGHDPEEHLGQPAYAYHAMYQDFLPLLTRWGQLIELNRPESELDYALWRAEQDGLNAVSLSFLPFQSLYVSRRAANVIYPLWEYPDIPDANLGGSPRENWKHMADQVSLILTATSHSAKAFERAGVRTPVEVVPPPIADELFGVPLWTPTGNTSLLCRAVVFPHVRVSKMEQIDPWRPQAPVRMSTPAALRAGLRRAYQAYLRPALPKKADRYLTLSVRGLKGLLRKPKCEPMPVLRFEASAILDLTGIVYTALLNPFDQRENWNDLLSAYLHALADQQDALLVIRPQFRQSSSIEFLNQLIDSYLQLGLRHRCRVAFLVDPLSRASMLELARGTTYYLTAPRAKRRCRALANFLAAGRPAIGPVHTAMRDCFAEDRGFVVASHPEPTFWPNDPERRLVTTWHRIVWQSLCEQIQESYRVAKQAAGEYQSRAMCARLKMKEWAGTERIETRLAAALGRASRAVDSQRVSPSRVLRQAS
jgi:hypothetical protein